MEIAYFEKPRHGSVRRAANIAKDWMLMNLDYSFIDATVQLQDALMMQLKRDSEKLMEWSQFNESVSEYQTVMLATTLTLRDILKLEDELEYQEFEDIVLKSKEAIGGDAQHFFDISGIDSN